MTKREFYSKYKDQLQQAIWKEEIDLGFMEQKLEGVFLNKTKFESENHIDLKQFNKQVQSFEHDIALLERLIKESRGVIESTKDKLKFASK